jgi:hypothetical protein
MTFIIFLEDISEFSTFLVSSNLNRCFLENFNRSRLLILSFLRFDNSFFDLFFSSARLCRNTFYISKVPSLFYNSFQYFSLIRCFFIFSIRFYSIFSRYSYRISSFFFVDLCGLKNFFCDFNGRLLIFSYKVKFKKSKSIRMIFYRQYIIFNSKIIGSAIKRKEKNIARILNYPMINFI